MKFIDLSRPVRFRMLETENPIFYSTQTWRTIQIRRQNFNSPPSFLIHCSFSNAANMPLLEMRVFIMNVHQQVTDNSTDPLNNALQINYSTTWSCNNVTNNARCSADTVFFGNFNKKKSISPLKERRVRREESCRNTFHTCCLRHNGIAIE